jgi:predicted nuclease with RNAse H fold
MPRALGVDVGVRKGLDAVLLDDSLRPVAMHRHLPVDRLEALATELGPDIVAIDSPPAWGAGGGMRSCERELARLGIRSFGTPSDPGSGPFYDWMRVGFDVFRAADRAGFPLYAKGPFERTAIEVFPHASAVALAGALPPTKERKARWRGELLTAQGVDVRELRSADQIDAALAALTGLLALQGAACAVGDPEEGVIVLPLPALPETAYRRERRHPDPQVQPSFPGLGRCTCGQPGCTSSTSREFAPGHDAKLKSALWRQARHGDDAMAELRRRGWELPPELR